MKVRCDSCDGDFGFIDCGVMRLCQDCFDGKRPHNKNTEKENEYEKQSQDRS